MEQTENRPPFIQWLCFHVLPALSILVVVSFAVIGFAIAMRKPTEAKPTEKILPVVEVIEAQPEASRAIVASQGTVEARTQTTLFAEVAGRVESVSPALYAGGFFKKGDILATIDDTDYIANLAAAKSRYAEAELAYQQEQAASEQALEDWKALGEGDKPSDLVLRKPQLARALANLEATEAAAQSAERDLARTQVKAPYDGRVQKKFIDIGQYANARQTQIASIYSVDTAEIRLGISLQDTKLVNLPETYSDGTESGPKPTVTITANYGGHNYTWEGAIDRSEGAVDPQTRLLYLVAKIEDPYGKKPNSDRPPLKVGSFVTANIQGDTIANAYVIPRRALRENDTIYIIDQDRKLEVRPVEVLQKTTEIVIVQKGLSPGEMICLTPLQYVVNGMEVALTTDKEKKESEEEADPESEEANAE